MPKLTKAILARTSTNGQAKTTFAKYMKDGMAKPQVAAPKVRKTSWTAAELLAIDLPAPRFIVSSILPEGLTLLASRPKLGKSWLALQLGVSVASNTAALGSLVPTEGSVLYLALEDNPRRLKKRLNILLGQGYGKAGWLSRLRLETQWPKFGDGGGEKIAEWINSAANPRLVIIDTLARVRPPKASKNPYQDDYDDLSGIQVLAEEHGVAILAIHHTRKPTMAAEDIVDEVSGTTGITAAADTILVLKRGRNSAEASVTVCGRDVDGAELGLTLGEHGWQYEGNAVALRMSKAREELMACLKEHGPLTPAEAAPFVGKEPNTVKVTLYRMHKDGVLDSRDGRYSVPTAV